jgi:Spy/CpxP family protein refolding chaperone
MRFRAILTIGLVGLATAAAFAQQPGQQGQRGRGGPPGGGFGFFGGGGMTSRLSLLGIAEVQKELELADEQVKEIQKLQEEFRARFRSPGGGPPGAGEGRRGRPDGDGKRGDTKRGDNNRGDKASRTVPADWYFVQAQQEQPRRPGSFQLTDEQRAEIEKQRLERSREEKAKLAEILLPNQIERLTQIFIQVAGVEALRDEEVAKELGISEAQSAKLAEVRRANQEEIGPQMRELFGGGEGDREANRAKFDQLRKAGDLKVLALLTPDQKKKFEEMKGKSFKMPEGAGRGGFGGRGGPGGERGRRPDGKN